MTNDKRPMKKQLKRTMWFIGVYAIVALVISAILIVYGVPQWLNMIVIIALAGATYLPFYFICATIDKKKKEKEEENPKDDPFSE